MTDPAADPLAALRARVLEGHDAVSAGRYDDAAATFREALDGLAEHLGADHPEVQDLVADLVTVADMAGVARFGEEMGFRWSPLPKPD